MSANDEHESMFAREQAVVDDLRLKEALAERWARYLEARSEGSVTTVNADAIRDLIQSDITYVFYPWQLLSTGGEDAPGHATTLTLDAAAELIKNSDQECRAAGAVEELNRLIELARRQRNGAENVGRFGAFNLVHQWLCHQRLIGDGYQEDDQADAPTPGETADERETEPLSTPSERQEDPGAALTPDAAGRTFAPFALITAAEALKADLIRRAGFTEDPSVVDASDGVWQRFCDALAAVQPSESRELRFASDTAATAKEAAASAVIWSQSEPTRNLPISMAQVQRYVEDLRKGRFPVLAQDGETYRVIRVEVTPAMEKYEAVVTGDFVIDPDALPLRPGSVPNSITASLVDPDDEVWAAARASLGNSA